MNMAALSFLCRLALRFALLLLVLSALYDLSIPVSFCFDPSPPILPETLPLCFLSHYEMLIRGVGRGGLPGAVWHFLPAIVVTILVTIIWAWKGRRRERP